MELLVRKSVALEVVYIRLIKVQAELQPEVKAIIPLIPELLVKGDYNTRVAILELLKRFATNGTLAVIRDDPN
jgi:hypothetical protein